MLWQFFTLLSSQETASWAEAGVQCRLLHSSASLAMPKTAEANKFLAEVNTNLTEAGDAVHADMWVSSVFYSELWIVNYYHCERWIGGTVKHDDSKWYWVDGTPIDQRWGNSLINLQFYINSCSSLQVLNWAPGQPDNVYGGINDFC